MSNTKRDWAKPQSEALTKALAAFHIGKASLVHVFEEVESIVRREMAGEVEKMIIRMPTREGRVFNEAIGKVLALLSPQNEKDQ